MQAGPKGEWRTRWFSYRAKTGYSSIVPLRQLQDFEDEPVFQGDITQSLISAAHAAMASAQLGLEQQQVVVGAGGAQFCHPFGRFPILHTAVVVAGDHQGCGVSLG